MRYLCAGILLFLITCSLEQAASVWAAVPAAGSEVVQATEDVGEVLWQAPRRLEPIRALTSLPELERSVLETLSKLEEEASRLAAEEERINLERDAVLKREQARIDEERAKAEARLALERQEARSRAITAALRAASPPPPAVLPLKQNWPLPDLVEPESWMTGEVAEYYRKGASEQGVRESYLYFLEEAIKGNPRAMLILAHAYAEWGKDVSSSFSVLYEPMHDAGYWRSWADRLAGQGWTALRLGDLESDTAKKAAYFEEAAALSNAEAKYKLYELDGNPDLLVEAAMAGNGAASASLAASLSEGRDGFPQSPRLAASFWWRAALAGEPEASLVCSEYFQQGRDAFPKDERQAWVWAMHAHRQAESADADSLKTGLAQRASAQLNELEAGLRMSAEDKWRLQQEFEIHRAAQREARLARLDRQAADRAGAIRELQSELYGVAEVLAAGQPEASEQQLLERMRQALDHAEYQELLASQQAQERERRQSALQFIFFGAITAFLVCLIYLSLRLHLFSRVAKLVAVNGGKA